jgi:DNA-binding MarR family transcriptional regulator
MPDRSDLHSSSEADFNALRCIIVDLVREEAPLSLYQLGVFLTCYLNDDEHTVRGLARNLNVSKSVITRALDRLAERCLIVRKLDPSDARSILVERTPGGLAMMQALHQVAVN